MRRFCFFLLLTNSGITEHRLSLLRQKWGQNPVFEPERQYIKNFVC